MVMFVVQHTPCIVVVSAKTINNCAQISWTKEISFGYTNVTATTNSDVFIALMNKVKIIRGHRHRTIKVSKIGRRSSKVHVNSIRFFVVLISENTSSMKEKTSSLVEIPVLFTISHPRT